MEQSTQPIKCAQKGASKKSTKKLIVFQNTATQQVKEYAKHRRIKSFHKALHSLLAIGYESFQQSREQQ